ncbi:hypothetical protein [Brumimicrobium aurantiacum]|nr:hypothetical protein [Brumimicrobium aurantiacum]
MRLKKGSSLLRIIGLTIGQGVIGEKSFTNYISPQSGCNINKKTNIVF